VTLTISPEYLAGFFDGEGCIGITVSGKERQVKLRLILVNTDYEFLEEIQRQYGGSLSRRIQKKKLTWKPFCSLEWAHMAAADLIKIMLPHLRLKKQQANLALEFRQFMELPKEQRCLFLVRPDRAKRNRHVVIRKPETIAKELEFKAKMHQLNRKGVAA
jgi:hypothetical protein